MSIATTTNTSSHSKTCAWKKHDRHLNDASTAQKKTETSTNNRATRLAKFSKPLQRRSLEGENTLGFSVSANAKFTNFVTLLHFSWPSGARVVDFEMSRPSIERPMMTGRYPNHPRHRVLRPDGRFADEAPEVKIRSATPSRERTRRHQQHPSNFRNLVTTKKLHEHVMMQQDQPPLSIGGGCTNLYHETVCGAMARMSACAAVVLQCLFDLLVSLDGWWCQKLAHVVIFMVTRT